MARPPILTKKQKVQEVLRRLYLLFPDPQCELWHRSPWELLVATILSAQATDKLVNTVTPTLFEHFPTVKSFTEASLEEIDAELKRVNYHTSKAKNIRGAARKIIEEFSGHVPSTLEELITLPGVGRKTANVVLGTCFGTAEGIVVDTHVARLSKKLGLTTQTDPVKIEKDLLEIVPPAEWVNFSHLLILTGREYCPARGHRCENCPLSNLYVE